MYRLRVPKYNAILEFMNFSVLLLAFVLCLASQSFNTFLYSIFPNSRMIQVRMRRRRGWLHGKLYSSPWLFPSLWGNTLPQKNTAGSVNQFYIFNSFPLFISIFDFSLHSKRGVLSHASLGSLTDQDVDVECLRFIVHRHFPRLSCSPNPGHCKKRWYIIFFLTQTQCRNCYSLTSRLISYGFWNPRLWGLHSISPVGDISAIPVADYQFNNQTGFLRCLK